MNAITLDDKYTATSGRVYLTGSQALVRLPIEQARRDALAGHNTAGFISGYRGSPLGNYDTALWAATKHLEANRIHFQPGVNEDLAATAVWGTQQLGLTGGARRDGVFGLWYGKGPGVDRSGDALKHANFAGTSPLGGVVALCGDDHGGRSSTLAHQSDQALIHFGMPVLNPADIQDFIDLGLIGFALSRYAGLWAGMKCVTDVVDGSASILAGDDRIAPVLPTDFVMPEDGLSIRREFAPLGQEARQFEWRLIAAQAFARANGIDHQLFGPDGRKRLGIVASGKMVPDVLEAFERLGIGQADAKKMGIALFKVAMVWPLEPQGIGKFASQCEELLVIEEKRGVIEDQLARQLFNLPADRRPRLVGKRDEAGAPLLSEIAELSPDMAMSAIAARYDALAGKPVLRDRADTALALSASSGEAKPLAVRPASFCAGCPHNTSTVVPEGSVALGGIGCHGMAAFMPERNTLPPSHMGGEGASWIGQAPFSQREHIFQNIGDGTYFHSGLLSVRACVAAQVNITYKVLLNGAVGMTGGQPIEGEKFEGEITAPHVAHQVASEGVGRIAVVSDDADRFAGAQSQFPASTSFHHRDELDKVQRELREWKGVSVLIYDQSCATERRRLRKRGKVAPATERLFIASEVCEGCGDCGAQSNCIALEPLETEMGRKRRINQSVCNQDYSCLKGFCPSFITITGGKPRARAVVESADEDLTSGLPEPEFAALDGGRSLLVTGIGGAGVVTVGAILGMAAHSEGIGCTVLDMSGFAQRNGSVMSHIRLGSGQRAARIPPGAADLVIGCDPIVAAGPDVLAMVKPEAGRVVLNSFIAPTKAFALDPDYNVDLSLLERRLSARVGEGHVLPLEATRLASTLLGDAVGANMMLVGFAWQQGLIPIPRAAIEQALRLNGTAVAMNLRAFSLGRLGAADPARLKAMLGETQLAPKGEPQALTEMVESRMAHLTGYQDASLAERYKALVDRVASAETALGMGDRLAWTVARTYARLLAYKDEYEVARLLTGANFRRELDEAFEGDVRIELNLAPPLLSRRDPETGRLRKRSFGPWMLKAMALLARMKRLRGGALDIFGYHAHRRKERALIGQYEALVGEILAGLTAANYRAAIDLAALHGTIRGYDVVKEASIAAVEAQLADKRSAFQNAGAAHGSTVEALAAAGG